MTDGWKVHLNGVQEIVESRVRHPHLNIAQHDEMVIGGNNIWLTEIRYGRWEMEWEQEMAVGRSRDKAWWEYDIVSGNRRDDVWWEYLADRTVGEAKTYPWPTPSRGQHGSVLVHVDLHF